MPLDGLPAHLNRPPGTWADTTHTGGAGPRLHGILLPVAVCGFGGTFYRRGFLPPHGVGPMQTFPCELPAI